MITELARGIRRVGPVTNLAAAAAANAQVCFTYSTFAAMIGTKTLIIRRIKVRNNGAGNTWVHFGTGTGATFADAIPALWSVSNTTDDYVEGDIPAVELLASITAYPDAVGAGDFDVQVEVEEIG